MDVSCDDGTVNGDKKNAHQLLHSAVAAEINSREPQEDTVVGKAGGGGGFRR